MMSLTRLDKYIVKNKLAKSREHARGIIMAGNVFVNGQKVDKAGFKISSDAKIEIKNNKLPYVSRGGIKLAGALD